MSAHKIAVVVCSTRSKRVCPFIAQYIQPLLQPSEQTTTTTTTSADILDLSDLGLPLFNEPSVPSGLPADDPTPHYAFEHTRNWSRIVSGYSAFVFVTPQYNWSIPAGLKNALDYLFHEWVGKPAGIVTYGGRGGTKGGAHLRDILNGLRMKPVATSPAMHLGRNTLNDAVRDSAVSSADVARWQEDGIPRQVEAMYAEIVDVLNQEAPAL